MDITGFFNKLKGWLLIAVPAVIGLAIAVVMRRKPVANPAQEPVARHDMAQADANVQVLEQQQVVLEQQHQEIVEVLKPKPVLEESLQDAVDRYNRNR